MSLVVKTSTHVPDDGPVQVEERVAKGTTIGIGEEIFVWTAETSGGKGLSRRGEVTNVIPTGVGRRQVITIRLDPRRPRRSFTKDDLAKRDHRKANRRRTYDAEETLSEKLLVHSHNRCVALTGDEAAFLNAFFA